MHRMFSVAKSMSVRKFNFGSLATLNFESSVTKPALTRIWPEMARPVLKTENIQKNLDNLRIDSELRQNRCSGLLLFVHLALSIAVP